MKKIFYCIAVMALMTTFVACTQDTLLDDHNIGGDTPSILSKKEAITTFSEILSRATYGEPELRTFLKNQALLKKDNDYNVFYPLVKNEIVYNNKTFSQVLEKYASDKKVLSDIENSFPLLNIFIPDLTVFDENLAVEKLDTKDKSIPVFSTGKFYVNGNVVDSITEGECEFPLFHTFVVNESHRRIIKSQTRTSSSNNIEYGFADDAYNPEKVTLSYTDTRVKEVWSEITENVSELYNSKNSFVDINEFPVETLNAFKKVGAGMGALRPMIYYNLNKLEDFNSPNAILDYSVKDVIYRMKVGREFYSYLSHYKEKDFLNPYLSEDWYERKYERNRTMTYDQLAAHFWSSGNFTFKVNVVTGSYNQLHTIIIRPQDLFTLTFQRAYKHHTWFTDAKTRWMVKINEIESKWVYPHKLKIDTRFSPWDPKTDSYKRSIFVSVAGSNVSKQKVVEVSSTKMNKESVSAGLNIPISFGEQGNTNFNLTAGWENQNTTTNKETVTITVTDNDREMGNNFFSFFGSSPISEVSNNKVYLETTRYGCFDMCIIPVRRNLAR